MSNHDILVWRINDDLFWKEKGQWIAYKNLFWSVITLTLAFMIWLYWGAFTVYLGALRPDFSLPQLYWLTSLPLVSAGLLRIVYSFTIPFYGGRNWTTFSTLIMLAPLIGIYFCIGNKNTPYAAYVFISFLTGIGGANFASSSANISLFFPHRLKSIALGINASLGNVGVGIIQVILPFSLTLLLGRSLGLTSFQLSDNVTIYPQTLPILLSVIVIIFSIFAWFGMNNLVLPKKSLAQQFQVLKDKDCWIISLLYTQTFGSFIGFAAVIPLISKSNFHQLNVSVYLLIGVALSSFIRPASNFISKYIGAVKLTIVSFIIMALSMIMMWLSMPNGSGDGNYSLFIKSYMLLFIGTGLGKGSTTSLIPEIYTVKYLKDINNLGDNKSTRINQANQTTAAVLGITSAIATLGAIFIPEVFNITQNVMGNISIGITFFFCLNILCIFITCWFYLKQDITNPLFIRNSSGQNRIIDRPNLHHLI